MSDDKIFEEILSRKNPLLFLVFLRFQHRLKIPPKIVFPYSHIKDEFSMNPGFHSVKN